LRIPPKLALPLLAVLAAAVPVTLAALPAGAATAGVSAACVKRTFPGVAPSHTTNLNAKGNWNSFPPTSGRHYQLPAKFNLYSQPIPQIAVVHNLEHGGVALQYGRRVSAATVRKIRAWYLRDTNAVLVAPLPELGRRIAMTAWNAPPYAGTNPDPGRGVLLLCSAYDQRALDAFRKQHRYKAGERFPKRFLARQQ
jgi:hypothetical protein